MRKISRKVKMLPFTCYHECYAYFNAYTEQAENHFQNRELTTARLFYQRALELKCAYAGHGALLSRINEIDAFLNKKIAAEESYKHLLEEAQKKFDKKDYLEALRLYKEANMIRPTAPLTRLRIDEINHILK